jgi:outer membrane protein, heavy metal efflux system
MKKGLFILLLVSGFSGYAQNLEDFLKLAAENNPGVKAKYAEFEAALNRSAQVSQMPNPSVSIGYFLVPVETRVGAQRAKVGLSQMFPWFGSLKARGDMSAHMAEAKYFDFVDARERLFLEVKTVYFELSENDKIHLLEQENKQVLEAMRALGVTKYENGTGSLANVYRADVFIDESETRIELLSMKRDVLIINFNNLLDSDSAKRGVINEFDEVEQITINSDSLDFSMHPKQRSIAEMQASALASENAAIKQGLPGIGVGIDYIFVNDRTDVAVPNSGRDAIMPMVSISLPIYRKGYKAAKNEAIKLQTAYALRSESLDNRLESMWAAANYRRLEAKTELELLDRQIQKSETIVQLLLNEYASDSVPFEELLREQIKLVDYRFQEAKTWAKLQTSQAEIEYLNTSASK